MLNRMMHNKLFCGLDIGAHKIKAGLLEINSSSEIKLLGVYESKVSGFTHDAVSNLGELSECIHHVLEMLTKKTNVKIRDVQLGVNGRFVDMRLVHTVIPLMDKRVKVIGHKDIKKVNEQVKLLGVNVEEEILHDLPQYYQVDDQDFIVNPIGLYGRKLGVQSLLIVANTTNLKNIIKAVHQAGFDVANIFFSSLAASEVVLTNEQKKNGVALIDVGSNGTSVVIFKNSVLQFVKYIPIGADHFTKTIADKLNLPFDLAEEIKKSYAVVMNKENLREEEILVKKESAYIPFKRADVCESIEPVIDQWVNDILQAVKNSSLADQVNDGYVFLGGGALLSGLIERFGQNVNVNTSLCKITTLPSVMLENSAGFSTVLGLAFSGYKQSINHSFDDQQEGHWPKRLSNTIKNLYQEYF